MSGTARYLIWLGLLGALAVVAVAAFSFVSFVEALATREPEDLPSAQGIVVLTGGADRVVDGLRLLEEGKGQRLLVSGVHPGTTLNELKRLMPMHAQSLTCCVDLDHRAANTRANAREAARWARRNGFAELTVVTASYHVPRTALEFAHQLPKTRLHYFPVVPDRLSLEKWWREPTLLRILMLEYAKFRLAQLRIGTGLAAAPVSGT